MLHSEKDSQIRIGLSIILHIAYVAMGCDMAFHHESDCDAGQNNWVFAIYVHYLQILRVNGSLDDLIGIDVTRTHCETKLLTNFSNKDRFLIEY